MRLSEFTHWLARRIAPWDGAEDGNVSGRWTGLTAEARAPLVAALCTAGSMPRKVLVVTSSYDKALQWQARLGLCGVPADQVKVLPNGQSSLYEDSSPETVALSERIGALRFLVSDGPGIVIGSAQAVLERTLPREDLSASFVQIKPGETWDLDSTCKLLERLGHELGEPVRVPGQYSRRGGILDVFPMGSERPLRVELFGDEVETVREFDPMTQRSQGSAAGLEVGPSRETLLPEQAAQVAEMIGHALNIEADRMPDDYSRRLRELVEGDIRSLLKGSYFDRLDLYRPLLHPDSGCAVDLVPEGGTVVLDEPDELEAVAAKSESELQDALQHRHNRGEILHSTTNDFLLPPEHLGSNSQTLSLSMGDGPNWLPSSKSTAIGAASLAGYRGQPTLLTKSLKDWLEQGFIIGLSTEQPLRAKSMLSQVDLFTVEEGFEDAKGGEVFLLEGNLAGGFVVPDSKLALVTDQELFGVARLRLAQRKFSEGIPVTTILDLQPGDFVVHINFGIGIYRGLTSRVTDGVEKEFLQIDYQVPDKLFVPADQLDRIQKYLAPEDSPPKINRLTGSEWKKTVSKAREEAREFARGLIALYAERKKVSRKSYGPDTPWQSEMEHTFPWVETPSQLAAIQDVKTDLKTDFPMDRLVCGDVGFGKTEVAIRATFKVVQEGKQVAILCPTTILSEQHYRNFVERLAGFPTRLDILNRFRTAAEKTDVKKKLESGEVDVLIGTHALLNKELKFKNLGLLVIDEEQKFGVKHKEALKSLKVSVDVLTLSATPIPRTLSMALMNIRQMSLINDPPPGRLPVRTIVRPFSSEVIRDALLRELARGGQVYYVFNRVEGIYHVAEKIRKLIPQATVAVAHGQMHEKEIEPVMVGFVKGEIDILVSTTIVENGLDIPNSNTLIVENSDKFGLSQLYQLRGRVGRSDRQAYAYFLYAGNKELTEQATSRLQALQDFSHLGSGYSLAFRDLQIRGAGDLLGAKQSGQINAVGFDLYTQLIESEVGFLKSVADGSEGAVHRDPLKGLAPLPVFDLPVTALIPSSYVREEGQRMFFYQAMMSSRSLDALSTVAKDIEDRYGKFPREVETALEIMRLRISAQELMIEKVDGKGGRLSVSFEQDHTHSVRVFSLVRQRKSDAYMSQDNLIWPFVGSVTSACRAMLEAVKTSAQMVEEQRAMLGVM